MTWDTMHCLLSMHALFEEFAMDSTALESPASRTSTVPTMNKYRFAYKWSAGDSPLVTFGRPESSRRLAGTCRPDTADTTANTQ